MNRIEKMIEMVNNCTEDLDSLGTIPTNKITLIDIKSNKGKRICTEQGANFITGNERFLAVKNDQLIGTIEKYSNTWLLRCGILSKPISFETQKQCVDYLTNRYA